jgi:integrase/recombinase XerD
LGWRVRIKVVDDYISTIGLNGVTDNHIYNVRLILRHYLKAVNYYINKNSTFSYLKNLKNSCSIAHYRKQLYQIKKFLVHNNIEWINPVIPPRDPIYIAKRITDDDLNEVLNYFKGLKFELRYKSVIKLCCDSGIRAEECYQLRFEDIDLKNRIVYINHKPEIGQNTKTKQSRISFITEETSKILEEYYNCFKDKYTLKYLFGQSDIQRAFRKSPIRVKMFRKYFSQKWDRKGGPTSIKKILMGHSLKGDVDLMHYNAQSEEDLKQIYDKVMNKNG